MKTKWKKTLAALLAFSIFMTQVSYFPSWAAENIAGEITETEETGETETTETELQVLTETESEAITESEALTESETESEALTESETESEAMTESEAETEALTETQTETENESEAMTETQTETGLETETEAAQEPEDGEIAEPQEDNNASIAGTSFTVTDLRDETKTKLLDVDDGVQAVYVFGGLSTCYNTKSALASLTTCIGYYDMDALNIFAFDIMDSSEEDIVSSLETVGVSEEIIVSSTSLSDEVNSFFSSCLSATVNAGFTMPLIIYKGTDGEIYDYTTGYQSLSAICEKIEAGGLTQTGAEDEDDGGDGTDETDYAEDGDGLLYVVSDLDYAMAYEILDFVNEEREAEGLSALTMDEGLLETAMQRAVECQVYYSHTRPNGSSCFTAFPSDAMAMAENIAYGYSGASAVMEGWMNSSGHKANILGSSYKSIGIGVSNAGGRLSFVQCFGSASATELAQPENVTGKSFEVAYSTDYVTPALASDSKSLAGGKTYTVSIKAGYITSGDAISPASYTWTSSDENVATVDASGTVTAVAKGTAAITGTNIGNKSYTLTLQVTVTSGTAVTGTTDPPVADVASGSAVGKGTLVTLTCATDGAKIYYTTDGSTPTTKSTVYKNPITISADTTITAYAVSSGNADSEVVSFTYTLKTCTVTFDSDGGTEVASATVYQNDAAQEPDAPTKAGYHFEGWYLGDTLYDFSSAVTEDITLTAKWKEYETLAAPTASLTSGMKLEMGTKVTLFHEIAGVTIYYTTDGSTPTTDSTTYTGAIAINADTTIQAIAAKDGYKNSAVAAFTYTVTTEDIWGDVAAEDVPDGDSSQIPSGLWVTGIMDATYTGKAITQSFHVYNGKTLLVEKTDYTVSYKNNVNAADAGAAKAPTVVITGKGNYSGKMTISFTIKQKDIGDSDVTADDIALAYAKGKTVKATPVLTYNQKKLSNKKDYTIESPTAFSGEGSDTIEITGKGNYTGTRTINVTVTDKTLISKASVSKIANQPYTGAEVTLEELTVKVGKTVLTLDKDYTLTYEENVNIGTASVLITGKNGYAGTKRVTFKIVSPYKNGKYDIGADPEELIDVDMDDAVDFVKGGSTPNIKVSYNGKRLTQGTDYTLSFKNNKAATAVSGKQGTVTITGKGSYCGKITKDFTIKQKDISETTLIANDKVYTGRANGYTTKLTLTDTDGKALKAGTDYEKEIKYTYRDETPLENGETRAAGAEVESGDIIPAGTTITVTVTGKGSYKKSNEGEYRIIAKENDISKAKVTLTEPQYYDGTAKTPDAGAFEVKLGNNSSIAAGTDYSIVGYTNNIKKGKATVTIRGEDKYGGTKTAKFAIQSKSVSGLMFISK